MGMMAGRSVIANRWEGLAEGIQFIDRTNVWAGTQAQGASTSQSLANVNLRERLNLANAGNTSVAGGIAAQANNPFFGGTTSPNPFFQNDGLLINPN